MSAHSACGDIPLGLPYGIHYVGHGFTPPPLGTDCKHYQQHQVRATTRKIAEPEGAPVCFDSQHMPPTMQVFSPGTWDHTCPSCGLVTVFQVSR